MQLQGTYSYKRRHGIVPCLKSRSHSISHSISRHSQLRGFAFRIGALQVLTCMRVFCYHSHSQAYDTVQTFLIFFKFGITVFFMCSCILLTRVALLFGASSQLNSMVLDPHTHLLIDCLLGACLHFVFLCVVWKADQIGNDLMIVAVLFSANQHVSLPSSGFNFYQSQILCITGMQYFHILPPFQM